MDYFSLHSLESFRLKTFFLYPFSLAFDTPTGMPYGTVNLRHGVPKGETTVTCTAGVGTFLLEFGALSRLTGDPIFEKTAVRAVRALWKFRSPLGLVNNLDFQSFLALFLV